MKTILLIFIIFFVVFGQHSKQDNWVKQLIQKPDVVFADDYEKYLFAEFRKKFPELVIKNTVHNTNAIILDIMLDSDESYYLACMVDKHKRIKHIYRYIPAFNNDNYSISDQIITRWVGKFFYHLDIGDKEAVYDLVYHNDTKLVYKQISSKKEIINSLMRDFPKIIKPDKIDISAAASQYRVAIYIYLTSNLLLEINSKLANITDTDELQENLFTALGKSIKTVGPVQHNSDVIKSIISVYNNIKIKKDTLQIDYPDIGMKALKNINYIFKKREDKEDFYSLISLQGNNIEETLTLNKSYPLSIYNNFNRIDKHKMEQAIAALYNQFIQMQFANYDFSQWQIKGIVKYRGYLYHDIIINNTLGWTAFLRELAKEGALYFYPSAIETAQDKIIVHGLIYILKDQQMNFYHFGEIVAKFNKLNNLNNIEIELNLYPFLSRVGVKNFDKK